MSAWMLCERCGQRLDYQVGSIAWCCCERDGDEHLCPSCAGKKSADEIIGIFREGLKATSRALEPKA